VGFRFLYPYNDDNYGVLLHCPSSLQTASIDCGDANATQQALAAKGWSLTDIWVTHHHADHTEGVVELKQASGARVVGPNRAESPIQGIDEVLAGGDTFTFAEQPVQVLHTPGHTLDMLNYYLPQEALLFSGDTLFTLGCGRLFEGDAAMMWESLAKLIALPDNTAVYGSHEYTVANAAFAVTVDPNNDALQARVGDITRMRANNEPTVPTVLSDELKTNPFLRANDASIRQTLGLTKLRITFFNKRTHSLTLPVGTKQ